VRDHVGSILGEEPESLIARHVVLFKKGRGEVRAVETLEEVGGG
jgi:hypothetical protein